MRVAQLRGIAAYRQLRHVPADSKRAGILRNTIILCEQTWGMELELMRYYRPALKRLWMIGARGSE